MEFKMEFLDDEAMMAQFVASTCKGKDMRRQRKIQKKRNKFAEKIVSNIANATMETCTPEVEFNEVTESMSDVKEMVKDAITDSMADKIVNEEVFNKEDENEVEAVEEETAPSQRFINLPDEVNTSEYSGDDETDKSVEEDFEETCEEDDDEDTPRFEIGEYDRLCINDNIIGTYTFSPKPEPIIESTVDAVILADLSSLTLTNIITKLTPSFISSVGEIKRYLDGVTKFPVNKYIMVRYPIYNDDTDMVIGYIRDDKDLDLWLGLMTVYTESYSMTEVANILLSITMWLSTNNFQSQMMGEYAEFRKDASSMDAISDYMDRLLSDEYTVLDKNAYIEGTGDVVFSEDSPYEFYVVNCFEDEIMKMFGLDEEEGTGEANAERPFRESDDNGIQPEGEYVDGGTSADAEDSSRPADDRGCDESDSEPDEEIEEEKETQEEINDEEPGDIDLDSALQKAIEEAMEEAGEDFE